MQRPADLDARGIEKSKRRSWKVLSFFEEVPLSSRDCRSSMCCLKCRGRHVSICPKNQPSANDV